MGLTQSRSKRKLGVLNTALKTINRALIASVLLGTITDESQIDPSTLFYSFHDSSPQSKTTRIASGSSSRSRSERALSTSKRSRAILHRSTSSAWEYCKSLVADKQVPSALIQCPVTYAYSVYATLLHPSRLTYQSSTRCRHHRSQ